MWVRASGFRGRALNTKSPGLYHGERPATRREKGAAGGGWREGEALIKLVPGIPERARTRRQRTNYTIPGPGTGDHEEPRRERQRAKGDEDDREETTAKDDAPAIGHRSPGHGESNNSETCAYTGGIAHADQLTGPASLRDWCLSYFSIRPVLRCTLNYNRPLGSPIETTTEDPASLGNSRRPRTKWQAPRKRDRKGGG